MISFTLNLKLESGLIALSVNNYVLSLAPCHYYLVIIMLIPYSFKGFE